MSFRRKFERRKNKQKATFFNWTKRLRNAKIRRNWKIQNKNWKLRKKPKTKFSWRCWTTDTIIEMCFRAHRMPSVRMAFQFTTKPMIPQLTLYLSPSLSLSLYCCTFFSLYCYSLRSCHFTTWTVSVDMLSMGFICGVSTSLNCSHCLRCVNRSDIYFWHFECNEAIEESIDIYGRCWTYLNTEQIEERENNFEHNFSNARNDKNYVQDTSYLIRGKER